MSNPLPGRPPPSSSGATRDRRSLAWRCSNKTNKDEQQIKQVFSRFLYGMRHEVYCSHLST